MGAFFFFFFPFLLSSRNSTWKSGPTEPKKSPCNLASCRRLLCPPRGETSAPQGGKQDFHLHRAPGMEPPPAHRDTGAGQFPSRGAGDGRQRQALPLRCRGRSRQGRTRQPTSGHRLRHLLRSSPVPRQRFRHGRDTKPPGRFWPRALEAQGGLGVLAEVLPHLLLPPGTILPIRSDPPVATASPCPAPPKAHRPPNVTVGCQRQWGSKPRGASGTAPTAASPSRRTARGEGGPSGQGGAHMMVHRFLRRAPWKRMVVWTCLQRAQPTLFRSSLKSSRMCQLYLAEHSM